MQVSNVTCELNFNPVFTSIVQRACRAAQQRLSQSQRCVSTQDLASTLLDSRPHQRSIMSKSHLFRPVSGLEPRMEVT